jgi:hypothetical protein
MSQLSISYSKIPQALRDIAAATDQKNPMSAFSSGQESLIDEGQYQGYANPEAFGQEQNVRSFLGQVKQQLLMPMSPKEQALAVAKERAQQTMATMATDAKAFHALFKQVYGSRYDAATVEQLRNEMLAGDFSSMPDIKVVSSDTLQGHNAAYGDGVVYLNENLLNNPDEAAAYIIEETAHHFDTLFGPGDAAGDEGELFRRMVGGEKLSNEEISRIKSEDDRGVIEVDGKKIEVEFGWLSKKWKQVTGAVKKAFHGIVNAVRDLTKAIVAVTQLTIQLAMFPLDYAINGDKAIDRLKETAQKALVAVMKSELLQWAITAAVTFFSGGSLTGPLLIMQEAMKQGIIAALKQAAIELVKREVMEFVTEKVVKATGSEWLGTVVGSLMSNPKELSNLVSSLQESMASLTMDQIVDLAKDEVLKQAKKLVIDKIAEEVDFAPLKQLLTGWVDNGANWDDLTDSLQNLDKSLGKAVSKLSWDKVIEQSKDMAKEYAVSKIGEEIGFTPLSNGLQNWVRDGFDLSKLPEMLDTVTDDTKAELSKMAVDKITDEIGLVPLRDGLVKWVEAGADFSKLPDVLESAYGQLKPELLKKINSDVGYEPLRSGLETWVSRGASLSEFDDVLVTLKAGVDTDIKVSLDKFDAANMKAKKALEGVSANVADSLSLQPLRDLWGALNSGDGKNPVRQNEASESLPLLNFTDLMANLKSQFGEKANTEVVNQFSRHVNVPGAQNAVAAWVNNGADMNQFEAMIGQLSKSVLKAQPASGENTSAKLDEVALKLRPEIMSQILGGLDIKSGSNLVTEMKEALGKINKLLEQSGHLAERLPDSTFRESSLAFLQDQVMPEFSQLVEKADRYIDTLEQLKHTSDNKARYMQQLQFAG